MSHTTITIDGHTVSITGPDAEALAKRLSVKLVPIAWAVMEAGACVSVRRFEPSPMSKQAGVEFVALGAIPRSEAYTDLVSDGGMDPR